MRQDVINKVQVKKREMLIQLIHDKVLLRINAHQFYFLIYLFELKDIYIKLERKESFIVNFIYHFYSFGVKMQDINKARIGFREI